MFQQYFSFITATEHFHESKFSYWRSCPLGELFPHVSTCEFYNISTNNQRQQTDYSSSHSDLNHLQIIITTKDNTKEKERNDNKYGTSKEMDCLPSINDNSVNIILHCK